MNTATLAPAAASDHGTLTDATTFTLQRQLPATPDRVWPWLVDGDLRRRWLAAGDMALQPGTPFELVWRNDELPTQPTSGPPASPPSRAPSAS